MLTVNLWTYSRFLLLFPIISNRETLQFITVLNKYMHRIRHFTREWTAGERNGIKSNKTDVVYRTLATNHYVLLQPANTSGTPPEAEHRNCQ